MAAFLQDCAHRLDAGESAEGVIRDLRARYKTERCLSVRMCAVRGLCAWSESYRAARATLLEEAAEQPASLPIRKALAYADVGKRVPMAVLESLEEPWRAKLRGLPPHLPDNVRAVRLTRQETRECKKLQARQALERNRAVRCVDGTALLSHARSVLDQAVIQLGPSESKRRMAGEQPLAELALALMLLTGRRTCEVLNGRSAFDVQGAHALRFRGQAKKRDVPCPVEEKGQDGSTGYDIVTLAPAEQVLAGMQVLRNLQAASRSGMCTEGNAACSRRYQSLLSRTMAASGIWRQCGHAHGLRGLYVCMALSLFDWRGCTRCPETGAEQTPSRNYVAMKLLGHEGMQESLVYTTYDVGTLQVPHLGPGVQV